MDRLERLVNLVAALIETPRPLTRADIHERIEGYSAEPEAFRRNFERDKDLLRQMGFPVVTEAPDPGHPEDVGYRIPRELYELPDPGLDEEELAALRLAASAVQMDAEWAPDAVVRALRKLGGAVAGPAPTEGGPVPAGPVAVAALPAGDAAAVAFSAVGERRRVRFRYKGEDRLVDPWRLSFSRGHWYLTGFDHGRGEERLYRLDRLDGAMSAEGPAAAFARPASAQTEPPPAWRIGEEEETVATVLVDADHAAWGRQTFGAELVEEERPDGAVVFKVAVTNREALRSLVVGWLDHAEILGPPDLRADMVRWLEAMA